MSNKFSTLGSEYYNTDGSRKSMAQRQAERQKADDARKQAALNAPKPEPVEARKYAEYEALRDAERSGTEHAKRAREARQDVVPTNPHRARLLEVEADFNMPEWQKVARRKQYSKLADEFDATQEAIRKEAARKKRLLSDPRVAQAIEYAEITLKHAAPEDMADATELLAIARECEPDLFWERSRALEQKVYARADAVKQAAFPPSAEAALKAREALRALEDSAARLKVIDENINE